MSATSKIESVVVAVCVTTAMAAIANAQIGGNTSSREPVAGSYEVPPWYVSVGAGAYMFENDEAVENGFLGTIRLGYDLSPRWSFELSLYYAPSLSSNTVFNYEENGQWLPQPVPRQGLSAESTAAYGAAVDALFHLAVTEDRHWDPYLIAGLGLTYFDEDRPHRLKADPLLRYGLGMAYHFNDEWAVRADLIGIVTIEHTEFNWMPTAGLNWKWGTHVPRKLAVSGGELDSDGDGLSDERERVLGTNPFDPDTDKDKLSDGEEVLVHMTDPLNPDTDYDGLKDGEEVYAHKTNPLVRDTDNGGVADGHEVIEDGTDPLDPTDDLLLFTLHIEFDTDKALIKPEYFPDLDKIGKVLSRDPGSTARIEGHADQRRTSVADYNQKLSERRANAVADYLEQSFKIARSRMTPVGYGFSRPVAKNDPIVGNPRNRRVEVYIRKGSQQP